MSKRDRGARWSSPKQADRKRKSRSFNLSDPLQDRLDELRAQKENISAIAEEALRAHPKVGLPPEHGDVEPQGTQTQNESS